MSPLAWWWHTGEGTAYDTSDDENSELIERLTFGMKGTGVGSNAFVIPSNLHRDYNRKKLFNEGGRYSHQIRELMLEIAGELRHVFGFLMALASTKSTLKDGAKHSHSRMQSKGKPLFPLEPQDPCICICVPSTTRRDRCCERRITKHRMKMTMTFGRI